MKKLAVLWSAALFFASVAYGQLKPGYVVTSGEPFPIVADFNGDGLDDLVQEERTVVINDGTTLSQLRSLPFGPTEQVRGVLDVNGDHIPDILTVDRGVVTPTTYGGTGSGPMWKLYVGDASRNYTARPIVVSTGGTPYIADIDGDGKDDFLVLTPVFDGVREIYMSAQVYRSRGDGTFDKLDVFRMPVDPQNNETNNRLLVGDVNHDGLPDIVMRSPEDLVVLLGTGGGHFNLETRFIPLDVAFGWWDTQLADVDGDGNLDVIEPGLHRIRVFFGDGHGNFGRMATTTIAKVHDAVLPPGVPMLGTIDTSNQPRDLAVGHFTRADRVQIAAPTGEGDIVVFSYKNGALTEDSRTTTEFLNPDIRSGHFGNAAADSIYVMGTYLWSDTMPKPRVFGADSLSSAAPLQMLPSLHHRATPSARAAATPFQVQITGDCIPGTSGRYAFQRDGIFGAARTSDTTMDAVFDGQTIYMRIFVPYLSYEMDVKLTQGSNGSYSGTANIVPSCGGLHTATVTLTQ